ncbi:MAG: hypothetical protein K9H64_05980 [Bacteroidales bacterium]|nr:hypothetical protein [Bacteroidales bacterium]MCF8455454.1 hypothetical protein [Bacteroidales bacterium]
MKKKIKTIIFVLLASNLFAQDYQVKEIVAEWNDKDSEYVTWIYKFPYLFGKSEPIARTINQTIFNSFIGAGYAGGDSTYIFTVLFEFFDNEETTMPWISHVDFEFKCLTSRIYSVIMISSINGAGSTMGIEYYNFDLLTGKQICFEALFSTDGYRIISEQLSAWKKKEIEDFVVKTKKEIENGEVDKNFKYEYDKNLEYYQEMLESTIKADFEYFEFILCNGTLTCIERNYSPLDYWDMIGDYIFEVDYEIFKDSFSDFGKEIMEGSKN